MVKNKAEALEALRALQLPPFFECIWKGDVPAVISDDCKPPSRFFDVVSAAAASGAPDLLPLWEDRPGVVDGQALDHVKAFAPETGQYVVWYLDPPHEIELLGENYQQFIGTVLAELAMSGVWPELNDLAILFEFKYMERLEEFWKQYSKGGLKAGALQELIAEFE